MEAKQQTIQQIERALTKVVTKCRVKYEFPVLTDIHIQVKPDSGEMLIFNDDDEEITRCVVEEWINSSEEDFFNAITPVLRQCIQSMQKEWETLPLLKPYSFVLVYDEGETVCDLYLVDDDTLILDKDLLKGLDEELDAFLKDLLKD